MKYMFSARPALLLSMLLLSSLVTNARMPLMEGMKTSWVGDELVHNGGAMQVQAFFYSGSPAEVLSYYEQQWQQAVASDLPGFIRSQAGGWEIISRLEQGENQVVQVRLSEAGGSEGYLSTVSVEAGRTQKSQTDSEAALARFPVKAGSDLVSVTQASDLNGEAFTYIFTNQQSVNANTQYYLDRASGLGWQQVNRRRFDDVSVLFFNVEDGQIEIAIHSRQPGFTVILANVVSKG